AESDQLLAEQHQPHRLAVGLQLRREARRHPVFAHQVAHRRARADMRQHLIGGRSQHRFLRFVRSADVCTRIAYSLRTGEVAASRKSCHLLLLDTGPWRVHMASISLGDPFEKFAQEQIAQGRYQNVSEVVRAGLRMLEDYEMIRQERQRSLKARINDAWDDPRPSLTADEVFDQLEKHHLEA